MNRNYTASDIEDALDYEIEYNFTSLRQGLTWLLEGVLIEQYQFNPKRPFGNSDWYTLIGHSLRRFEPEAENNGYSVNDAYERAVSAVLDHIFEKPDEVAAADRLIAAVQRFAHRLGKRSKRASVRAQEMRGRPNEIARQEGYATGLQAVSNELNSLIEGEGFGTKCPGSYGSHYVVTRNMHEHPTAPCPACGLRLFVSRCESEHNRDAGCSRVVFPDHDHGQLREDTLRAFGSPQPPADTGGQLARIARKIRDTLFP